MKNKLKVGDLVKSVYRSCWYGRVTEVVNRAGFSPLVSVTTICSSKGVPHRKPYHKVYDQGWLRKVERLPLNYLNSQSQ